MKSKNTGNYRLCKHQVGIGGTITTIKEYKDEIDVLNALKEISKDKNWEYYCEREVIYQDTQLDKNKNPIDSTRTWIKLNK